MGKWLNRRTFTIIFLAVIAILITFFILPVSLPLIFALITAILLEPLVRMTMTRFKWKRKLTVISVYIFFLLLLALLIYFTVTQLVGRLINFTKSAPETFNAIAGAWIDMQDKMFNYTEGMPLEVVESIQNGMNQVIESARDFLLAFVNYDVITGLLTGIPNFLVSLLFYAIALFLFMLDLPGLKKTVFDRLTDSTSQKVKLMTDRLNRTVFGFIKAQFLVSLIILAASFVGLLIIKPEYAILMSIIIWIIDLIPILGSIIILGPWSIYQFAVGDVAEGTKLAILAAILLVTRRTVEPKVMGEQLGLSPLATLISMFIGLKLLGFLGLFIGPLIVILFTTAREAGIIKMEFKI
ncbi:sporulation integral membrane protein YtvI [Bhargavaea massiliensis]|uniref:sporulation integral membrane protein YtvI n=1 Tax=Bhargavaea massiliensis TaxID=2697500 RepID=UPI001BCCC1CD|nr:sporulation integral membrane protein YtvI [Bhargavaea massiliensis]